MALGRMALDEQEERGKWTPVIVALLLGVLIGWWIIGWWLWPVTYTNALPQDLRAVERDHYLTMVAESYSASGDLALAQERLSTWSAEDLETDLTNLQTRLAPQDPFRSSQVQGLAGALNLAGVAPVEQPASAATPALTPAVEGEEPVTLGERLGRACTGGLWLILALGGIVVITFLWQRWRAAQAGEAAPSFPFIDQIAEKLQSISLQAKRVPPEDTPGVGVDPWSGAGWQEPGEFSGGEPTVETITWVESIDGESESADGDSESGMAETPPSVKPEAQALPPWGSAAALPRGNAMQEIARRVLPHTEARPAQAENRAALGELRQTAEFAAGYRIGEPDYDEAFNIFSGDGDSLGQCGLGLTTPIGAGAEQASALQVWLWDATDPDTQVKVLVSEGAYRDTVKRSQLAGQYPAVSIRQGSEFELETYRLLLRGTVEDVTYADQEPLRAVFAEVRVRLQVFQKSQ